MSITYLGAFQSASFIMANSIQIPFYVEPNSVGSSSSIEMLVERALDSNELYIPHPVSTFFIRIQGDSMVNAGVFSSDILTVDRSLTAKHGDIIAASIDGKMTVKTLELKSDILLRPKNKAYNAESNTPMPVTVESDFEVFGVVTSVIRNSIIN